MSPTSRVAANGQFTVSVTLDDIRVHLQTKRMENSFETKKERSTRSYIRSEASSSKFFVGPVYQSFVGIAEPCWSASCRSSSLQLWSKCARECVRRQLSNIYRLGRWMARPQFTIYVSFSGEAKASGHFSLQCSFGSSFVLVCEVSTTNSCRKKQDGENFRFSPFLVFTSLCQVVVYVPLARDRHEPVQTQ